MAEVIIEGRKDLRSFQGDQYLYLDDKSSKESLQCQFFGAAGASTDPVDDGFAKFSRSFSTKSARKIFLHVDLIAAMISIKFSSRSELSSRFSGRLKFSVVFEEVEDKGPKGWRTKAQGIDSVFGPPWREDYRREVN